MSIESAIPLQLFQSSQIEDEWIREQASAIPGNIMQKIISANGFKLLAVSHTRVSLKNDVEGLDAEIQSLYHKLFLSTWHYIQDNSRPILISLGMINTQMSGEDSGGKFLGSFVYDAIMTLPAVKEHCSQQIPNSKT